MYSMNMTKSEIEKRANEILSKYSAKGGIFKQFDKILKDENIKFRKIEAENDKFLGAFILAPNKQKYIIINSNIDNEGRKNFTIAHELGHYFLNHHLRSDIPIDDVISEDCSNKDPIEYEADYFATYLLMPEEKITRAFKSMLYNARNISNKEYFVLNTHTYGTWRHICNELTKRYGVSETALRYRLSRLGLLIINLN